MILGSRKLHMNLNLFPNLKDLGLAGGFGAYGVPCYTKLFPSLFRHLRYPEIVKAPQTNYPMYTLSQLQNLSIVRRERS